MSCGCGNSKELKRQGAMEAAPCRKLFSRAYRFIAFKKSPVVGDLAEFHCWRMWEALETSCDVFFLEAG